VGQLLGQPQRAVGLLGLALPQELWEQAQFLLALQQMVLAVQQCLCLIVLLFLAALGCYRRHKLLVLPPTALIQSVS
jgi:hypothetical protein